MTFTASTSAALHALAQQALERMGSPGALGTKGAVARSPITGQPYGEIGGPLIAASLDVALDRANEIFATWRVVPAPKRAEVVRHLADELRRHKDDLATLVQIEAGKIRSEALGEVQEMIDICDFAVGLSRQLHGITIASERPLHRLTETWHPLGPIGVITAFNFPVAVWSWNAALAIICGDPVVWKPSDASSVTAVACTALARRAAVAAGAPEDLCQIVVGGADIGAADARRRS